MTGVNSCAVSVLGSPWRAFLLDYEIIAIFKCAGPCNQRRVLFVLSTHRWVPSSPNRKISRTMPYNGAPTTRNPTVRPSQYLPNAPRASPQFSRETPMSTTAAWSEFRRNLGTCIAALEEDEVLIINHKFSPHYVQFACLGWHGTRAEAASNAFIDAPECVLTAQQYKRMDRIGWHRATFLPDTPMTEAIISGSPNFFADAPYQNDMKTLAMMAVRAIREVYGVPHPGMLSYVAFHRDGTSVRFPTLRLLREMNTEVTIRSGSIESA